MATTSNESLTELERRAETTRAELAQTVDALHSRVTPDALKADVRNYARDTGQHMMQSIEDRVRENPLQAMALAVGIAYPLWRFIGKMPAPVLLIGAGLALSRRGNGSNGYSARYRDSYDSDFDEAIAGNEDGGPGVVDGLKEKASDIKEKASDIGSRISEKAHETMENVRNMASDTAARVQDKFASTYQSSRETAADTAQQVSEQMTDAYYRTRDNMADMIERHPLIVGGVAFAVGSLVAASVPVSSQENRLMGETADEIKRRGQGIASEGLQQAKTAAQQVYQTAASEIREGGLTPEAARNTARAAVETARDAVEQTVAGVSGADAQDRSNRSSRNPNT